MLETWLYAPVKAFLQEQGYQVRAEVRGCDIVAWQGDDLVIVEMKTSANLKLLVQAARAQTIADLVYVAIPEPKRKGADYRGVLRVFKRLQLGLLLVKETPLGISVRPALEPTRTNARINKRARTATINEAQARSGDHNTAGSTGVALVTAYRERAILIACFLEVIGETSPRNLTRLGTGPDTRAILASNHYGWFERVSRGVYGLTKEGKQGTKKWPAIRKRCLKMIKSTTF